MPKICSRILKNITLPFGLIKDLDMLKLMTFTNDYTHYAVGRWDTLPLFNQSGNSTSSISYEYMEQGKWTDNAERLPCITQLIRSLFKVEILRSARIFLAQGEGLIRLHRDFLEFKYGFTRLHLVLKTNLKAMNGEGSSAFHMEEGSIWYLEGRVPHWAINESEEPRYHLVCDFPSDIAPEQCLNEHVPCEKNINWRKRAELPSEYKLILKLLVENIDRDQIGQLFDVADIIFIKYETSVDDPYQLLLQYVEERQELTIPIFERRKTFLGT